MPQAPKILGRLRPAAATNVELAAVPAATAWHVTLIQACNTGTATARVRLWARDTALALDHYLVFDIEIPGADAASLNLGLMLETGEILGCRSDTGTVSFTVTGVELT